MQLLVRCGSGRLAAIDCEESRRGRRSHSVAIGLLLCGSGVCIAQDSFEDPGFHFDGSFRTRYESKQDFDFDGGEQTYLLTQLRLDFGYRPNERSNVFVQLQDARIFGESVTGAPPINADAVPNIYVDHLDFHQAYFEHDFGSKALRVGRQKLNLADRRLVASLEWVNTARVHDAISFSFGDSGARRIELFASKLVAVDPHHLNDQNTVGNRYFDSDFHGAFVTEPELLSGQLEYWYFYRGNGDFDDRVSTIGARLLRPLKAWQLDLQSAYQFGDFDGLDHSAYMLHIGLGRTFDSGRWGVAYNLASGDKDPNDGDHGTFDNLYPLNHPYYGIMDLFSLQNMHNLELIYARTLGERVRLQVGWQSFWLNEEDTDAWYGASLAPLRRADAPVSSHVGNELDITASVPLAGERFTLVVGVSRFFGGHYLRDTGPDGDANFFFLQLSYSPNL
jgi:hypothetical protein